MATRIDREIVEAQQQRPDSKHAECTLAEAALTVLGLLGFIVIPAIIGLVGLTIISWIVRNAGFDVLTF